jgi:MarR family 2-MHQ and catechol resistance regulon transcriptional repressor
MKTPTQHEQDLSGMHLWLLLWKASRAVEAHSARSIARFDMGVSDFGVLEALLHKGPLTVKQLGEKVLLTSGSMTAAVDRLIKRGLVTRCDDERDRRARIIQLTDKGKETISQAFTQHRLAMESAVGNFSQQERVELLPLLRRLGRTAEENP